MLFSVHPIVHIHLPYCTPTNCCFRIYTLTKQMASNTTNITLNKKVHTQFLVKKIQEHTLAYDVTHSFVVAVFFTLVVVYLFTFCPLHLFDT